MELVEVNLQDVPAAIRRKVAAEAKRNDMSVSYVVAKAVGMSTGNDLEPPRGKYSGGATHATMVVSLPEPLRRVLRMEAARKGATIRGLILAALAERYALPPIDPGRRARNTRRT